MEKNSWCFWGNIEGPQIHQNSFTCDENSNKGTSSHEKQKINKWMKFNSDADFPSQDQ